MKKVASIFLTAVVGGITALGVNHYFNAKQIQSDVENATPVMHQQTQPVNFIPTAGAIPENAVDFTVSAEQSVHSVVNIKSTYPMNYGNQYMYDPFRDFFGRTPRPQEAPTSTGSGVIISQDGYIVTNNHVIDGSEKIEVTLNDKRSYPAEVIGKTQQLILLY